MNDDQYLLASAYADGELTPAERAVAEADPAVMAEVDRLQALREALRDVAPPAEGARAAIIAAAMREFHAAVDVAPVTAPVVTHRRPARWFTWERAAGLAAAALAVVAIGAVVVSGTRGGGDDDSADLAEAPEMADGADDAADATAALNTPAEEDTRMAAAPADTMAAAATEAPGVLAAPPEGSGEATESTSALAGDSASRPVIESAEQLAAAGVELRDAYLAEPASSDETIARAETAGCTFTAAVESPAAIPEAADLRDDRPELAERVELLDLREYRVGPDEVRPAWIAVDVETGQAFAVDASVCALLAVGPLP